MKIYIGLIFIIPSLALSNNLIEEDQIFSKNARIINERSVTGDVYVIQAGEKNGYKYRFHHSDGSGEFAGDKKNDVSYTRTDRENWKLACNSDQITDEKSCSASIGGLIISYSKKYGLMADVIGSKYPGSEIVVRINKDSPIAARENFGFSSKQSEKIISSITDGSRLVIRYVDWPYNRNVDKTTDVYNVKSVIEYMKWVVDK